MQVEHRATPDLRVALIGNPNCGKTTIFNALTGAKQRVGNWAGVTVCAQEGMIKKCERQDIEVTDCPGVYTLTCAGGEGAGDEAVTVETLKSQAFDYIINIIDITQLSRQLYLTLQLRERGFPLIVILNGIDKLKAHERIDEKKLEERLGCPVLTVCGLQPETLDKVAALFSRDLLSLPRFAVPYPAVFEQGLNGLAKELGDTQSMRATALTLLEGDMLAKQALPITMHGTISNAQQQIARQTGIACDVLIAQCRYQWIDATMDFISQRPNRSIVSHTSRIDQVLLNRFLGIPAFLCIMYALFFFAINIGGLFQPFFELSSRAIFVDGLAALLSALSIPAPIIALLASGIGLGISTTVTFIPVIGGMFIGLSYLEQSGYMARAAFVMDRLMRAVGLPGKSFVPMIIGFGCNVPAVMAARTLESERDRVLTVMMMPFMSCGARLAIFAVFVAAFFPIGGQNVVFFLYLLGISMAVLTGLFLKHTFLPGRPAPLILEMPSYQSPSLSSILRQAGYRLSKFVTKAGQLIVPVCLVIGALNAIGTDGSLHLNDPNPKSVLSTVGRGLTPIFEPMGISSDNWPATVGLLTGVLAKEVVVGTLNALYDGEDRGSVPEDFSLSEALIAAVMTIPDEWGDLTVHMGHLPTVSDIDVHEHEHLFGEMYARFGGVASAFSYLLFILLYMPCVSTVAAMVREVGLKWAYFSVVWTTAVAYGAAVGFYQIATFEDHPISSLLWLSAIVLTVMGLLLVFKRHKQPIAKRVPTPVVITVGH